jgi:hypothetical protein
MRFAEKEMSSVNPLSVPHYEVNRRKVSNMKERTTLWVSEPGWVKRDRTDKVVEAGLGQSNRGQPVELNFHRRQLVTVGNTSEPLPHALCKTLVRELQLTQPEAIGQLMKIERMALTLFKDADPPIDRRGRYSSKRKADETTQ